MSEHELALAAIADGRAVMVERVTTTSGSTGLAEEPSAEGKGVSVVEATVGSKMAAEVEIVDKIAEVFREKARWSVKELEAKGVETKNFKRPFVVAHLGARHGLMITAKKRETVFIAVDIGTVVSTGSSAIGGETSAAAVGEDVLDKSDYFWMPPQAKDIEQALAKRMTVLVWGPPGSGKTTMLERILNKLYGSHHFMSLHGDMSRDDFYGTKELKDGTTYFRWGPASEAMRKKEPLILNELDAAPPEILFCLQRVLEKKDIIMDAVNDEAGKPMRLSPWHAEEVSVVKVDEDGKKVTVVETMDSQFCIAATANTIGRGDDTGLYRGAQILNEAFLDRFDMVEYLGYPPPRYEAAILNKRTGISLEKAKEMVKVADAARKGFKDERKLNSTFSVRKTLNWSRLQVLLGKSCKDAFISTVLSRVTPEDRTALAEMYQRVYGERINTSAIG